MKTLRNVQASDAVAIAIAADALALPPGQYGVLPAWWTPAPVFGSGGGVVPELELEIWAPAPLALTGAILYGARMHPLTFSDVTVVPTVVKADLDLAGHTTHLDNKVRAKVAGYGGNGFTLALVQSGSAPDAGIMTVIGKAYTFTFKDNTTAQSDLNSAITASADLEVETAGTGATKLRTVGEVLGATALAGGSATMHATTHGLKTGDGDVLQTAQTAFPAGLDGVTGYWVIRDSADIFSLAASLTDALSGIPVDFTTAGTGTQKATATSSTQRVYWETHDGLLGPAGDGAVTLDVQVGYSKRIPHSPRVVAYALVGTIDTGSLSAAIYPIQDRE